ncbi:hypothetical protein [Nocardia gipuzkoensis]|nr:hypothetical protein [Nocardia gipuzkoensis]MDE1669985.1 hypothetical protein [Nocardia gipuzkoensis]
MSASKFLGALVSALTTAVAVSVLSVHPAGAEPARARVVGEVPLGGSVSQIDVYSPSMDRVVANRVIRAAGGGPAPTLYLLTGIGGGVDGISWWDDTDV